MSLSNDSTDSLAATAPEVTQPELGAGAPLASPPPGEQRGVSSAATAALPSYSQMARPSDPATLAMLMNTERNSPGPGNPTAAGAGGGAGVGAGAGAGADAPGAADANVTAVPEKSQPKKRARHPADEAPPVESPAAAIVGKRPGVRKGTFEYRVRWEGYGPEADTWEPKKHLKNAGSLVRKFDRAEAAREQLRKQTDKKYLKSLDKKSLLAWAFEQADANKERGTEAGPKRKRYRKSVATQTAPYGPNIVCEACPRPKAAWWVPPPDGYHAGRAQRLPIQVLCPENLDDTLSQRRWCRDCAVREHPEAVDCRLFLLGKCEDCVVEKATHGLIDSSASEYACKPRKRRWCAACAADHDKAEQIPHSVQNKTRCADCGLRHPTHQQLPQPGTETTEDDSRKLDSRRLCKICAEKRPAAYRYVAVQRERPLCEDCGARPRIFGLLEEKKWRWCVQRFRALVA
eukprot:SAG11_NODE_2560_length_3220_cov_2.450497_1_plen_460_part_00